MTADVAAVEAVDLTRSYEAGMHAVRGLDGVSLTVAAGEIVAVMGPSGSGKSTLLSLLGGLDKPDSGSMWITGVDWQTMKGADRARFRRRTCGFIAQGLTLLPQATTAENVEVPLLLDGRELGERRSAVADALERVGLERHASKMPDQLSGGEQQRAVIARARIGRPAVVLADEPTGNLDSATGQSVMELLTEAAGAQGAAVVLVTHDPAVAKHARRTVTLHSGRLDAAGVVPNLRGA